jgi:arylformamidase
MKIHDISLTISPSTPVWPGDTNVWLERVKKIENGDSDNLSQLKMGVHTGTHIDAPYHFVQDGIKVDELSLDTLIGPCQVIEVGDEVDLITADVIFKAKISSNIPRIIFKTRNSKHWLGENYEFDRNFVGISEEGATSLVKLGMKLVGLDYLSVAPFNLSKPVHDIFLQAGLILLEGADLSKILAGIFTLVCLPVKLGATEGAPARAVLIEDWTP